MSHAVVLQMELITEGPGHERMLTEHVLPHATSQPGFQKGIWMHSADYTGLAIVVFDTAANAEAAASALEPPPSGPVLISRTEYKVDVEG
ncbi:MAG: hypothetical protein M3R01_08650 [Actinomycetota bacterium]|nr:hypothetical protein [Actinomycetota bacterium]